MNPITALVIVHPGVEELECVAPVDLLRRAGVEVTLASCGKTDATGAVVGRNGITLLPDTSLDAVVGSDFDLLVIPGGPGVQALRGHPSVEARLRAQVERGGWIGCICAAPLLLNDAGLLQGHRFTAHPSVRGDLPAVDSAAVVRDGKLITAVGAATSVAFGLALVAALVSREAAEQVAEAIAFTDELTS